MIPRHERFTEDGMEEITIKTSRQVEMIDITQEINQKIKKGGIRDGICLVYCPHTTAGVTINENADPNVVRDILNGLDHLIPGDRPYLHFEGNSPAHIKSSIIGCSTQIIIEGGRLSLGTWQSVFFCEFDGPRNRSVWVKIIGG
jgi:secondary thiamine-phosphate synthase enzyme